MRRRLNAYFDRRGCRAADDLADETLNRVARRLEEQGTIEDAAPARYCYIVAKFVFLEALRREKRERNVDAAQASNSLGPGDGASVESSAEEARLVCLDRCLESLPSRDSELILGYYAEATQSRAEGRRDLAARLNLTVNALAIRACRIRETLERCVGACLGRSA